jgi:hypothetical protein
MDSAGYLINAEKVIKEVMANSNGNKIPVYATATLMLYALCSTRNSFDRKGIPRRGRMKNKIRQTFRKENNLYTMASLVSEPAVPMAHTLHQDQNQIKR